MTGVSVCNDEPDNRKPHHIAPYFLIYNIATGACASPAFDAGSGTALRVLRDGPFNAFHTPPLQLQLSAQSAARVHSLHTSEAMERLY